ncbi:MAG: mannose-6-phosphate isomerase [Ruminococcaceae bacterium]|nr:mannose-6-phosphate isomerase [Oscillospiraceae bacterium]
MKKPLRQTENRVYRTYRGGRLLERFVGKKAPADSAQPEDWISSFVQAKNKNFIPGEGISKVIVDGRELPITKVVAADDFGPGRSESGVLIKYLDAAERLGVQVHPTPAFSKKHFGTAYGKTECWHILETEGDAAVYIGFKEGITREKWRDLFDRQDVTGMLNALHRFAVKPGDTVLVRAGTPHAIDAGCFLLEIQEPSDYTMNAEKVTPAGVERTPQQIHYGVGEEAMLDCYVYEGLSEGVARAKFFLRPRVEKTENGELHTLVSYEDTSCFGLKKAVGEVRITPDCFVTLIMTKDGTITVGDTVLTSKKGEKWFVPHGCGSITVESGEAIVCYPPKI